MSRRSLTVLAGAVSAAAAATAYWQFLVLGLLLGLAGGCFAVGTPYVARWFPQERRGLAMGILGSAWRMAR